MHKKKRWKNSPGTPKCSAAKRPTRRKSGLFRPLPSYGKNKGSYEDKILQHQSGKTQIPRAPTPPGFAHKDRRNAYNRRDFKKGCGDE